MISPLVVQPEQLLRTIDVPNYDADDAFRDDIGAHTRRMLGLKVDENSQRKQNGNTEIDSRASAINIT